MNYIILIIVGVVGVLIGRRLAVRRCLAKNQCVECKNCEECLETAQSQQKKENKAEILKFLQQDSNPAEVRSKGFRMDGQVRKITNDEVEKLVGVSNNTAERYLDELEKEGKLIQNGETGRSVFYTLK